MRRGQGAGGNGADRPVLITGGAGFIGTNLADRLLREGVPVRILDNLSRPGVEHNLRWLQERHGPLLQTQLADLTQPGVVERAVRDTRGIYHFAAQVAVTTSLGSPLHDFEVNAKGTLLLLEAWRALNAPPPLLFTSTNKVYGALEELPLTREGKRYTPVDPQVRTRGIGESQSLCFHSPYGCSKGCADQYVLDHARTFSLPAAVFRMSCIYGPHQMGTEDQGWVAHFLLQLMRGAPLVIYGDGHQVRDVLFVEDLVDAMRLAQENMEAISGQAFNIGGGPPRAASLLELVGRLEALTGRRARIDFQPWRPADQRYYVSDPSRFMEATGWTPRVDIDEGLELLGRWMREMPSRPQWGLRHAEAPV